MEYLRRNSGKNNGISCKGKLCLGVKIKKERKEK
jgi:hypothetical protein